MATSLDYFINISANTQGLTKGIGESIKSTKALGIAAAAAGAAIVAAFAVQSVKAATELEAEMANVATLLDGDVTPRINEMKKEVQSLAIETGKATSDLTSGLYQVVSAFGDTADSTKILKIAAEAATAGLSTTTDSINLISAVTKGYGDTSAEAAQKVTDLAFQAVKLGQTTFPELAASIGKIVPLSEAMSVSQEELFGVMATLTGVTGNAAEVATQYRAVLVALTKPTENLQAIYDQLGVSTGKQLIEQEGFQGALMKVKGAAEENGLQLTDLMGRVEGVTAMMALTGAQADTFTEKLGKMTQASGAASKAFAIQKDTVAFAQQRIAAYSQVIKQKVGDVLLPLWADFLDVVIKAFGGLADQFRQAHQNIVSFTTKVKNVFRGFQRELYISISNVAAKLANLSKDAFPEFAEQMREMSLATGEAAREIQLNMDIDKAIASTIGLYSEKLEENRLINNKATIDARHAAEVQEILNNSYDEGTNTIKKETEAIKEQTKAIKERTMAQQVLETGIRSFEDGGAATRGREGFTYISPEGDIRQIEEPTEEDIRRRAIETGMDLSVAESMIRTEQTFNIYTADGQGAVDLMEKALNTGAR